MKICFLLVTLITMPHSYSNMDTTLFSTVQKPVLKSKQRLSLLKKIINRLTKYHNISINTNPSFLPRFIESSNIRSLIDKNLLSVIEQKFSFLGKLSLIDGFYIANTLQLPHEERSNTFTPEPNQTNFDNQTYTNLIDIFKKDDTLNNYLKYIEPKEHDAFSLLTHKTDNVVNKMIRKQFQFIKQNAEGENLRYIYTQEYRNNLYDHSILSDGLTLFLGMLTFAAGYNSNKNNDAIFPFLFCSTLCSFALNRVFLKKEYFFIFIRPYFALLANFIKEAEKIGNHLELHYPELLNTLPILNHLVHIKTRFAHSKKFNKLLDILEKDTFKDEKNVTFFCSIGNIKKAHKFFMAAQKEVDFIISAIGILQLYRGIAKIEDAPYNQVSLRNIQDALVYFHNHVML